MVGRTASAPSTTTGRSRMRPIQRIPPCGGLRIAVVMSTLDAAVRDRERPAVELGQRHATGASPLGQLDDPGVDLVEREAVGVADDGDQDAVLRVDGDADVDVGQDLDLVARDSGVEDGMPAQGVRTHGQEDRRVARSRLGRSAPAHKPTDLDLEDRA